MRNWKDKFFSLRNLNDKFFSYLRMSPQSFDELFALVSDHLTRQDTTHLTENTVRGTHRQWLLHFQHLLLQSALDV